MFPDLGRTAPLVPPLYPASVYTFPDLDALDAVYAGAEPGFVYARDGHPNGKHLADELTALEGGAWGIATGSGMGATVAAVLPLVAAGDRIVAASRLYGRTAQFFRDHLGRFGVTTTFADVSDPAAVRAAVEAGPCKVVFAETLSNPLCRAADISALADIAKSAGATLVIDNTFATPVLCRPLELGAGVVVESVTKLIGGHSDGTLGFVAGTDPAAFPAVKTTVSVWGLAAPPFDCWLAARGLGTLDLRARASAANAAAVADWLADRPGVKRVVYPGRPDHPDRAVAIRLFGDSPPGHMLCFELAGGRDAVNRFLRATPGIPFSPSLGDVTTTCSHPDTTSHRYDAAADKVREGITPGVIRLSVGCEPLARITAELSTGLSAEFPSTAAADSIR
ncbi:MAG: trans-sulfuration enzyme family protein [Fimbriiglobus sp.]